MKTVFVPAKAVVPAVYLPNTADKSCARAGGIPLYFSRRISPHALASNRAIKVTLN